MDEALTTKQLAGIASYSEYHFIRLFKAYTGSTVTDYACRHKVIKASEDVINEKRIIDVALDYCWQLHSGFTKVFNREFGFNTSLLRAMKLIALLQDRLKDNKINYNDDEIVGVYKYACKFYEGVSRYSGEEYVTHTINVALLLTELEADIEVILADMFCDIRKTVLFL